MYKSPKECYEKAPVRRETPVEARFRHYDQVPTWYFNRFLQRRAKPKGEIRGMDCTVNKGLRPGKPVYFKEVTNV